MDLEKRLDRIELALLRLGIEDTAKDLLLKAVITAHPNPAGVRAALQVALADYESRTSDAGFDVGWQPERVQEMQRLLRPVIARWEAWMTSPPKGGQEGPAAG